MLASGLRGTGFWIGAAVFLAAALAAALFVTNNYAFFAGYVILQFVVLATAPSLCQKTQ